VSEPLIAADASLGPQNPPHRGTSTSSLPQSGSAGMRAIKAQCRACVGGSAEEIKRCLETPGKSSVCELHRFLTRGKRGRSRWAGALRAIRAECRLCMGASAQGGSELIEGCPSRDCPLWPLRFGVRPQTARGQCLDVDP